MAFSSSFRFASPACSLPSDERDSRGLLRLRCFTCAPKLTQAQIGFWMLVAQAIGAICLFALRPISPSLSRVPLPLALIGVAVTTLLPVAYQSGMRHIRMVATLAYSLLVAFVIPEPYVTQHVCVALPLPVLVALVLRGTCCMTVSALLEYLVLIVRAKGQGIYLQPESLVLIGMINGGLILGRMSMDLALREAQAQKKVVEAQVADVRAAYDATIQGWARALELRDSETEGHSQRVTVLTMELAKVMGIPKSEWIHLKRGALLHDIGKMGVPDQILRKPGLLTQNERYIIEKHPVIAQELLEPIAFLREALEIPCFHHERWDGTGYPLGLKELEIPRAARLFAVVDVWDALTTDRPYRKAWSPERARNYLLDQAGRAFDPLVVYAFLELLDQELTGERLILSASYNVGAPERSARQG